ncbi:MAG: dipeptidase, partial [Planctomycetota bacterium]
MTNHHSSKAADLHRANVIWDAHTCLPLRAGQDMSVLERHRAAGASFVSVNVGMDFNPLSQVVHVIAGFRAWIDAHADGFLLAGTVADVGRAKRDGKLAVAFDLEGSAMLEDDLAMLGLFRDLGVRQIHLAYNRNNSIAGGCHDVDVPLSPLGRRVVREINATGLIMDCSHCGFLTSMEIMEISERPVVFSHSNVRALKDHPRNITDDQIEACARTGGVIGLSGIGIFLGQNDIHTETLLRHIDYVAERVGTRHIGLGLDYVFESEHDDLPPGEDHEHWWPSAHGYDPQRVAIIPPERLPEITEALLRHGFADDDVAGIMGGNFYRVAEET